MTSVLREIEAGYEDGCGGVWKPAMPLERVAGRQRQAGITALKTLGVLCLWVVPSLPHDSLRAQAVYIHLWFPSTSLGAVSAVQSTCGQKTVPETGGLKHAAFSRCVSIRLPTWSNEAFERPPECQAQNVPFACLPAEGWHCLLCGWLFNPRAEFQGREVRQKGHWSPDPIGDSSLVSFTSLSTRLPTSLPPLGGRKHEANSIGTH